MVKDVFRNVPLTLFTFQSEIIPGEDEVIIKKWPKFTIEQVY